MVHAEARDKAEHVRRLDSAAGSLSLARCARVMKNGNFDADTSLLSSTRAGNASVYSVQSPI